jgi:hypothetical protein
MAMAARRPIVKPGNPACGLMVKQIEKAIVEAGSTMHNNRHTGRLSEVDEEI